MTRDLGADTSLGCVVSSAPRAVWRDLLDRDDRAVVSLTPEWLDAVCAVTGGCDASRLYQWPDGRRLVLPLVRRRIGPGALALAESMPPQWGAGGVVSAGAPRREELQAVFADLAGHPRHRVRIRPVWSAHGEWSRAAPGNAVRVRHTREVLDLRGGFSEVCATRFSKTARRNARGGASGALRVECGCSAAMVDVFYRLYEQWAEQRARGRRLPIWLALRLARQREPRAKYEEVAARLGGACRIWVARCEGRPVAASISLIHGRHATAWRAASDRDLAWKTNANALLQRLMIEDACECGCTDYDMGESGGVASLIEFKRRFGAEQHCYDEYRLEPKPLTALDRGWSAARRAAERTLLGFGR